MRTAQIAATLALGLVLLPGTALAQPPRDKVVGSGRVAGGSGRADAFNVSARSRADNSNPRGQIHEFRVDFTPGGKGKGKVVCMTVVGNRAAVIAEFKGRQPYGSAFPFAALYVEDNGGPSSATPDRALATASATPNCALILSLGPGLAQPLEQGNVVVRDAT